MSSRLLGHLTRLIALCLAVLATASAGAQAPLPGALPATPQADALTTGPAPIFDPRLVDPNLVFPGAPIRGAVEDRPAEKPAQPSPGNTTVVPRGGAPRETPDPAAALVQLDLAAMLTDDGQQIDRGLVWRVFEDDAAKDGGSKLVVTSREPAPSLKLKPAAYIVNVAFGRANLTRKIVAKAGPAMRETFVLNAGGLKLTAVLDSNRKPAPNAVAYDIFSDERDQAGNRTRIMTGARPDLIIRLNAGIYHIVSTYGDANASVSTDVTVEAGKLTQVTVLHSAARVTFKLVARAGGDALAGTQWTLMTPRGEPVKESVGALPSHILAPGSYTIVARSGGKAFRRSFAVGAGDVAQVEVVMQ